MTLDLVNVFAEKFTCLEIQNRFVFRLVIDNFERAEL